MIYQYKLINRLNEVKNRKIDLYIRGAGEIGQQLLYELLELGFTVKAFLDIDLNKTGEGITVPILNPNIVKKLNKGSFFILITVAKDDSFYSIVNEYLELGLTVLEDFADCSSYSGKRLLTFRDIRPSFDFYKHEIQMAEDRFREMLEIDRNFNSEISYKNYNIIGNLDLPLTTYCNLQCKFCSHCMPYARPQRHFNSDLVLHDLDKLLKCSYVACLAIMGGEPFVYPNLTYFISNLDFLQNKGNIGFIRIVSNGTVCPNDDFFCSFSKLKNAYIYLSNYGAKSKKYKKFILNVKNLM